MNYKNLSALFLTVFILLLTAPTYAQTSNAIQGTWHLMGALPHNQSGRTFTWFLEWTFSGDNFYLTGYPPLGQKGKYHILKQEGNKLTLNLYEQTGNFGNKDKQIEIVVNNDNKSLKIDGKEGFTKVKKEKLTN